MALRQMGHSLIRSPHSWHVPWPHMKIMFFSRSRHTGHMVCRWTERSDNGVLVTECFILQRDIWRPHRGQKKQTKKTFLPVPYWFCTALELVTTIAAGLLLCVTAKLIQLQVELKGMAV